MAFLPRFRSPPLLSCHCWVQYSQNSLLQCCLKDVGFASQAAFPTLAAPRRVSLAQFSTSPTRRAISIGRNSLRQNRHYHLSKTFALQSKQPPSATATGGSDDGATKLVSDDGSNLFLDNLGKIFLAGLGLLVASLVRSYMGTTNRNRTRDRLIQEASLDPLEIDDLREANSELDLEVYQSVLRDLLEAYPDRSDITYAKFVRQVRVTMARLKGDAFTVQLGHLLDRVALDILRDRRQTSADPQPLALWMTVFSLALYAPVPERIQALFSVMQATAAHDTKGAEPGTVVMGETRSMVGYLQCSQQLVPESQVVAQPGHKFPVQAYAKGKPDDLFEWDGKETDTIDIDAFADILRSSAVCAWGECYHRKKFV